MASKEHRMMKPSKQVVFGGICLCIIIAGWLLGVFSTVEALFVRNQTFLTLSRGWPEVCSSTSISKERRLQLFGELQDFGRVWLKPATAESFYILAFEPWVVVTDTRQLEAEDPTWGGNTGSNQLAVNHLVIYSLGGGVRIPILLDETSVVTISVHGKHDAPPPVTLPVSVDDVLLGELLFERGDDTWGVESITTTVSGGCHWLRVWYTHDLFDKERQLDRNAYIDWVGIEKVQ